MLISIIRHRSHVDQATTSSGYLKNRFVTGPNYDDRTCLDTKDNFKKNVYFSNEMYKSSRKN